MGELANIPLQWAIWFGVVGLPVTAVNLAGFAVFALLLLEGAGYWTAKLRQLSTGAPLPPGVRVFAALRLANPVVLAAVLAWTATATERDPGAATVPGLAFAAFAALEHVNYFHVQLMYDNRADTRRLRARGLRRSQLARDLARLG